MTILLVCALGVLSPETTLVKKKVEITAEQYAWVNQDEDAESPQRTKRREILCKKAFHKHVELSWFEYKSRK